VAIGWLQSMMPQKVHRLEVLCFRHPQISKKASITAVRTTESSGHDLSHLTAVEISIHIWKIDRVPEVVLIGGAVKGARRRIFTPRWRF
jgi:ribosomal protein L3